MVNIVLDGKTWCHNNIYTHILLRKNWTTCYQVDMIIGNGQLDNTLIVTRMGIKAINVNVGM